VGVSQSLTKRDTAVIKRAQQKRLSVLHLREDRDWLSDYSSDPRLLLSRMAKRGALIRLGGGRYAIAALGDPTLARLPHLNLIDADLAPLGPYYVGFWSALALHGLTDVDSPSITVAIGFDNGRVQASANAISGTAVRVTRMSAELMHFGLETVRLSRSERYVRSDRERTLIDCLLRPRMAGSVELTMTAWGRALAHEELRVNVLADYAARLGPPASRRVGALLKVAGRNDLAAERFPAATRRARLLSLGAATPAVEDVDSEYRVALTPSRERLEGWLSYGK
jgi:predicted transcriptional regulator of viral defense system